jgi:hypothetical protein
MSLYNNNNDHTMPNFEDTSTRHPSFVSGASITSTTSNSSCNDHDHVSSVRSTNTTTNSGQELLSSSAVANNRVPPRAPAADDLDEDANQGANDLLMTAATALASFSSSQTLVRESATPRRDHDGGAGPGTRSVRLQQQQHQDYPSSTSSTNTGDDSSPPPPPPPLQQQLPLLLSSSRGHDYGARPTNHAAYELLDQHGGGWQEHDYGRGSHHRRGGVDDFAIIKEHLPNKAQSKQKAKRFPVKVSRFFRWIQRRVSCLTLFLTIVTDVGGANKTHVFLATRHL